MPPRVACCFRAVREPPARRGLYARAAACPNKDLPMESKHELAVLLMAYGTPGSLVEVEPYYTHIRRGRSPSPEQLEDLVGRYRRVGGVFPLQAITFEQAAKVEEALRASGRDAKVYVGMKHWHPYIAEAVDSMAADGVKLGVGLVLAPHFSRMSVGRYISDAEEERAKVAPGMELRFIERWGMNPAFLDALTSRVRAALQDNDPCRTLVLFTAHSLPESIRASNDPYERELLASARAVADELSLPEWRFAFQSASKTGEPWIGPDILDLIEAEHARGLCDSVVVCPVGFVADHLEILYDLDVEAAELCERLSLRFRRVPSLNSDPKLVEAVVSEVLCAAK